MTTSLQKVLMNGRSSGSFSDSAANIDDIRKNYYEGDHFLYWSKSFGLNLSVEERDIVLSQLREIFVSANYIKECIDRHVDALVGKNPTYDVTSLNDPVEDPDTDVEVESESNTLLKEAHKDLSSWVEFVYENCLLSLDDTQHLHPIAKCVTDAVVLGEGFLRIYQPNRYKNSKKIYNRIYLDAPDKDLVTFNADIEGMIESIDFRIKDKIIERQTLDPESGLLSFVYLDSATLEELVDDLYQPFSLDLGGNWTIYRFKAPSLVTESIRRQQNAINLVLTLAARNEIQTGFLERVLLNAQLPGTFKTINGKKEFVPDKDGFRTGADVTAYVQGIPLGDPNKPTGFTNPQVSYRPPVDVKSFIDSLSLFSARLYHEFGQAHILAGDDGSLNGVSRIQLRQDFERQLTHHIGTIERAISATYTSALRMLGIMRSSANYANLQVKVELQLASSLLTSEESRIYSEDFKANLISHRTALEKKGYNNPEQIMEELALESQEKQEAAMATAKQFSNLQVDDLPVQQKQAAKNAQTKTGSANANPAVTNPKDKTIGV